MSHRLIDPKDFIGKTIANVDARAVNITRFYFTDGTAIAIETEGDAMVTCNECLGPPPPKRRASSKRSAGMH